MYKDLSLKEKSELFKLMVSNGITDINEIEKIYNRYEDGGNKISVNNLPESEQYAVTTPDGQRKVFNNKEEAQAYITANTPKGYSLYDTTNYGSNIDKGQTAILNRNTEREIEKATEEEIRTNARKANIESNKEYAMEALNAMPIIGDGIIKPTSWILSQFNNGVTPEEVSIMLPEVTVVGNKKSRGGLINKYDGTSTKTQQMQTVEKPAFFEGDTWKPQYWFSPEYENATLKGAITQAYEDGNYGKDIIWNGRAYKAILNEEDANEYRKKKGIPLGEPIVNTANIQTNEKQPREYVSNSYIPVTNGNKIYYWDSYSGKFFEDAKGKTPTSKDYNTLLKDYYDQNISPALKENRYEDLIKLYVQQFRNLQARRRESAREQDIPSDYGKRTIPITTGRSGSSRLPYPIDLIDSLSNHLQEGQSIYQALALPYKETEFGNRVNFESDVMGNRGHVLATLNDERYELPDQTFYSGLSYPLRAYFRNNKVDGKVDGMTQENFVKHYLASSENDLLDLKNLFNNKELLKYVGETLKKDLTKSRFVSFMNTNTKDNPNIYEHALSLLASGKYNPGEPGYNKGINKIAKQLENDPELNNYIDKHKIKKVGEKKK